MSTHGCLSRMKTLSLQDVSETQLSQHFSAKELACPCCGRLVVCQMLVDSLEELRGLLQQPLYINSGYRCAEHNASVGGVHNSLHTKGMAADVRASGVSALSLFSFALKIPAFAHGGIGLYRNERFIHVDVRGKRARWRCVEGKILSLSSEEERLCL